LTPSVILVLAIVVVALALFVSGRLRVDLVGLLVLASLALTGLVTTQEALAGFSSPAVITVWAMFILSAGLTRTGLAHRIGQPLQRMAKAGEARLMAAIMVTAALLSALINTVTVAAILLPAVMEVARRSGRSPSRLLLPLALGCLLGGPFTGISTPPNILVTEALATAGERPFGLFEFTPITLAIVVAGVLFVVLAGRWLLPRGGGQDGPESELGGSYSIEEHLFTVRIPVGSRIAGLTLSESRLGAALSLSVVAIQRAGKLMLGPRAGDRIAAGDTLILHGRSDHLKRFGEGEAFEILDRSAVDESILEGLPIAEGRIPGGSPLIGSTLGSAGVRSQHRIHVLAMAQDGGGLVDNLKFHELEAGDRLVFRAETDAVDEIRAAGLLEDVRLLDPGEAADLTGGRESMMQVRVPPGSVLADTSLAENRLAGAFGLTAVGIISGDQVTLMPAATEVMSPGDIILLDGSRADLEVLRGLQELEVSEHGERLLAALESQQIGVTEVLLSLRSTLVGRTLGELLFRDHYGVSVLAIWSEGRAYRTGIQDRPLRFGDALLVYGPRRSIEAMARDPDFIVLDEAAARSPRLDKARLAGAIMLGVLVAALTGLVPIAIAALTGAALMVLVGCLSMEEAYRGIDWKVVFLVATMLPLGAAIEHTGAAALGAEALLGLVGDLSPRWVVAGLFLFTVVGTQVIPTAALVVMMAPIALSAATTLGISPQLLMMTVAISASSSYASPVSHPAHLLVMGPGGYRFVDYVKIGAPLTLVALAVSVGLLPVMFPP
jgi:di/tricarboxylate transporter